MATDCKLDQEDGTFIHLEARVVKAVGSDFMLDSPERRQGGGPFRRALVHSQGDGLNINHHGDYPGGVSIFGVTEIFPQPTVGAPINPTLKIHGAISYEAQLVKIGGGVHTVTVVVDDELGKLQSQISVLNAKVAALEALVNK